MSLNTIDELRFSFRPPEEHEFHLVPTCPKVEALLVNEPSGSKIFWVPLVSLVGGLGKRHPIFQHQKPLKPGTELVAVFIERPGECERYPYGISERVLDADFDGIGVPVGSA